MQSSPGELGRSAGVYIMQNTLVGGGGGGWRGEKKKMKSWGKKIKKGKEKGGKKKGKKDLKRKLDKGRFYLKRISKASCSRNTRWKSTTKALF